MNQNQFRAALSRLGIDQGEAAQLLGVTLRTVNGYANGNDIPLLVERFLDLLLDSKTPTHRYLNRT